MSRAEDATKLCTACGLCCDGTLFATARLTTAEAAAHKARRLPVVAGKVEGEALPQPCAALDGCRCTIYEARPASCRSFDCLLLHALRDGELLLAEALATVEEARARLRELPVSAAEARQRGTLSPDEEATLREVEAFLDLRFRGRLG